MAEIIHVVRDHHTYSAFSRALNDNSEAISDNFVTRFDEVDFNLKKVVVLSVSKIVQVVVKFIKTVKKYIEIRKIPLFELC